MSLNLLLFTVFLAGAVSGFMVAAVWRFRAHLFLEQVNERMDNLLHVIAEGRVFSLEDKAKKKE